MKHVNVALFVPHAGCPHTCSFCNQRAISGKTAPLTEDDIHRAAAIAVEGNPDPERSEIAFFGGSFTAVDRDYMVSLLQAANVYIKMGLFKGIRCSTRPDAVDGEVLDILADYGVTAIELGAQSMSDEVLSLNGRGHTADDTVRASQLIKSRGFELGLQMMTGLYGSSRETDLYTAGEIIRLKPKTVRIYPTIVLSGTELAQLYSEGKYRPQDLDEAAELCSEMLMMFHNEAIDVIRLGLHSGGGVEDGYMAGAYHPAFRELCESKIYLTKFKELLADSRTKNAVIGVNPRELSKAVGQKKCNLTALSQMGFSVKIKGSPCLKKYEAEIYEE